MSSVKEISRPNPSKGQRNPQRSSDIDGYTSRDDDEEEQSSYASSSSSYSSSSFSSSLSTSSSSSSSSSPLSWSGFSSLVRRRKASIGGGGGGEDVMSNDNNNSKNNQNSHNSHLSRTYQRRGYHRRATTTTTRRLRLSWSTWSLMVSIFVWSLVHLVYLPPKLQWEWSRMVRWREEEDTNAAWWMNQRHNDHNHTAAVAAAIVARTQRTQHTNRIHHRKPGVEDVPEGCDYAHSWQRTSFPTCNVLHELDMGRTLPVSSSRRRRQQQQRQRLLMNHQDESSPVQEQQDSNINHNNNTNNTSSSILSRYMGSGLWRDVFAIGSSTSPLVSSSSDDRFVLKLFKMEHYDDRDDFSFSSSSRQQMHRNVDRHRREATALAWVVPPTVILQPYAYCGTNLLTEWAPQSLHQALDELKSRSSSPTSNDTTMGRLQLQQQQQQQKFQWALEAARSVAALHAINVIHADLQTGQFLLKVDGTLVLNDLNRCRFVPYFVNGTTTTTTTMGNATDDHPHPQESSRTCPVRIPTAPGPWRSPEEYSHHNLTTAMDVYSLGNVLYELWTGNVPFKGVGSNAWKERVLDGTRRTSLLDTTNTTTTSTTSTITELERRFAQLLDACWKVNPHQRITAAHLAMELEELVRLSQQQEPQEQ